jgi:hypothetical protein
MLTFDAAVKVPTGYPNAGNSNTLSQNPNLGVTGLTNAYPTGWSRLLTGAAGNYNHSLGPWFFMPQQPWNNTYGGDANGYGPFP